MPVRALKALAEMWNGGVFDSLESAIGSAATMPDTPPKRQMHSSECADFFFRHISFGADQQGCIKQKQPASAATACHPKEAAEIVAAAVCFLIGKHLSATPALF